MTSEIGHISQNVVVVSYRPNLELLVTINMERRVNVIPESRESEEPGEGGRVSWLSGNPCSHSTRGLLSLLPILNSPKGPVVIVHTTIASSVVAD